MTELRSVAFLGHSEKYEAGWRQPYGHQSTRTSSRARAKRRWWRFDDSRTEYLGRAGCEAALSGNSTQMGQMGPVPHPPINTFGS